MPRPPANSGSAAGNGVVAGASCIETLPPIVEPMPVPYSWKLVKPREVKVSPFTVSPYPYMLLTVGPLNATSRTELYVVVPILKLTVGVSSR